MNIIVGGTECRNVEVNVNPIDVLNGLKTQVCKVPVDAYINKQEQVETKEDISYHGSPMYEYEQYQRANSQIEAIKCINTLKELLKEIE